MVTYETTFKEEAVKMASQVGAVKTAKDLGISVNTLYTWISRAKSEGHFLSHANKGKISANQENAHLVKRIKELEKANHILQEALRFFAVSQK